MTDNFNYGYNSKDEGNPADSYGLRPKGTKDTKPKKLSNKVAPEKQISLYSMIDTNPKIATNKKWTNSNHSGQDSKGKKKYSIESPISNKPFDKKSNEIPKTNKIGSLMNSPKNINIKTFKTPSNNFCISTSAIPKVAIEGCQFLSPSSTTHKSVGSNQSQVSKSKNLEKSSDEEGTIKKNNDFKVKYKTEKCKFWELNKECKYGDNCAFAHGVTDIKIRTDINPNYKTKKCIQFFDNGYCPYGTRCQFLHRENENQEKEKEKLYSPNNAQGSYNYSNILSYKNLTESLVSNNNLLNENLQLVHLPNNHNEKRLKTFEMLVERQNNIFNVNPYNSNNKNYDSSLNNNQSMKGTKEDLNITKTLSITKENLKEDSLDLDKKFSNYKEKEEDISAEFKEIQNEIQNYANNPPEDFVILNNENDDEDNMINYQLDKKTSRSRFFSI